MSLQRQKGAALLIAVFVIVIIGGTVGAMVALTSTTQQITSARNMQATRAFYAARARLDREIANVDASGSAGSPAGGVCEDHVDKDVPREIDGFTRDLLDCSKEEVADASEPYDVFYLKVAAFDGSRASGTLVRRELEAVVTNID